MAKKDNHLTEREEELMELFWNSEEPLTSVGILKTATGHSWSDSYIHIMLRSLLKKGMIKIIGIEQCGKQYARQLAPVITKEEYMARLVMSMGIGEDSIALFVLAMAKEVAGNDREQLVKELKNIIEELKEELKFNQK